MKHNAWLLALHWLWFFGLLLMGLAALWDKGILQLMFATDNTYLCLLMVKLRHHHVGAVGRRKNGGAFQYYPGWANHRH